MSTVVNVEKHQILAFVILTIFICVAGTVIGAFVGITISLMFTPVLMFVDISFVWQGAPLPYAGPFLGKASGLVAALVWCLAMILRESLPILKEKLYVPVWKLMTAGAFWGGIGCILYASLFCGGIRMVTSTLSFSKMFYLNVIYGMLPWLFLGFVGGFLCWVIIREQKTGVTKSETNPTT